MKYSDAILKLADLHSFLSTKIPDIRFREIFNPYEKPVIGNWADEDNLPIPVRGDGIGDKSGIYFFTTEDGEILYIGKASKNNIHERVWSHIQTPMSCDIEHWMTFPNNKFLRKNDNQYGELIKGGMIKLGVVEIYPSDVVSLAEVYLQTIYLPELCKRIG